MAIPPRLIHPIECIVELLDRDETTFDSDAREPIMQAEYSGSIAIDAQIKWGKQDNPVPNEAGVREMSDGYILVRLIDMEDLGITLKRGDRITEMGVNTGLDLYITHFQPAGHYPVTGGESLRRCFFKDRAPVKQIGDL